MSNVFCQFNTQIKTGSQKLRVSVIDLGFNSIKLANYQLNDNAGTYKAYRQVGVKVKLGEGFTRKPILGVVPTKRTIEALKLFRDIIAFDQIDTVFPVATSAAREAENRSDFLEQIQKKTGISFKILSGDQEAFYSFIGAAKSICTPNMLFFDIGGGSLELVYAENYRIKKIKSYPLGALRLSQLYGKSDGTFSKKRYEKMKDHIRHTLSDLDKLLDLSPDTELVGVGGALRAMARYNQDRMAYDLDKLHNYRMHYSSVLSIRKELYRMNNNELADIKAIGANRIDTIVAGSTIISLLMSMLGFENITVSAQGLREGILAAYAQNPKSFYDHNEPDLENTASSLLIPSASQKEIIPDPIVGLIEPLLFTGLLREKEKMILTHAIVQTLNLTPITMTNVSNLFYILIDEDNAFLSHREQLIMALSIVHTKKVNTADWLFSRYRTILDPKNKNSIEKISACLVIYDILAKMKSLAILDFIDKRDTHKANVSIMAPWTSLRKRPINTVPSFMLAMALKNFERAFDIHVNNCYVSFGGIENKLDKSSAMHTARDTESITYKNSNYSAVKDMTDNPR